jgi:carbon-monoxide dehydrogenase small subunit
VTIPYTLTVNGAEHRVEDAWLGESLLYVLRERLELPGSKAGCDQGECGSCSVIIDGSLECACLVMAAAAVGCDIVTIEGLQPARGGFTTIQEAFLTEGAVQCGFCTPGLVVALTDLLARNPHPGELEVREAISGNLCRCTGYGRILAAAQTAAAAAGPAERGAGGALQE